MRLNEGELKRRSLFSYDKFEECLEIGHPPIIKNDFQIHGSSNGLLCISDWHLNLKSPICNPSIQKYVILPKTSILHKDLYYDPSKLNDDDDYYDDYDPSDDGDNDDDNDNFYDGDGRTEANQRRL
ncbi:hypothetical protein ACFXTH_046479 [Malus domestica]